MQRTEIKDCIIFEFVVAYILAKKLGIVFTIIMVDEQKTKNNKRLMVDNKIPGYPAKIPDRGIIQLTAEKKANFDPTIKLVLKKEAII